jgi:tRNA(Ile)-lysidine synthase
VLSGRAASALDRLAGHHPTIALAVSGGSDSLAMLLLAHDWARATGRALVAASVDHGLRPEAAAEAEGVARLCRDLEVEHRTLRWRPTGPVSQADARMARHALLASWANARGAGVLALGHTQDDRIETFLIRARAGSFWHGLAGPLPRAASPAWPEGAGLTIIRPVLAFARETLREELVRRDVGWIDDPSNAAERFERVRMRRLTRLLSPETRASLLRSLDRLGQLRAASLAGAREGLVHLVRPGPNSALIDADGLRALPAGARRRLVEAVVLAAGGAAGPVPPAPLGRLVARMDNPGALGRAVTLAGARIVERNGAFTITEATPRRHAAGSAAAGFARDHARAFGRVAALLVDPDLAALAV